MENKIKSKVDVSVNISMVDSFTGKVLGKIDRVEHSNDFKFTTVSYTYFTDDNRVIQSNFIEFDENDLNSLSNYVKTILPSNWNELNEVEQLNFKYLTGFKVKMAETFSINISDIEII